MVVRSLVQQVMLQSTRCLVCCSQFAAAASSRWAPPQHLDCLQPFASSIQPAAQRAALPAVWSSSRSFLSSIMQPESKVYKERRLIGYSPEQLYEVVSNVQHYSRFVPWCVGSTVLTRQQDGRYLEAELQIGFQMISEKYTSKVTLHPPNKVSSTVADSALFHHLESVWQMTPGPSPNSTWLSFSVDFAFLNPLYANVAQLFFSEVVTRMMGAFEGRCRELYGQPSFMPAPAAAAAAGRGGSGGVQQHHVPAGRQHHHLAQQHQQHRQQPAAAMGGQAGGVCDEGTDADHQQDGQQQGQITTGQQHGDR